MFIRLLLNMPRKRWRAHREAARRAAREVQP
jgi:hypothetical protein